MQGAYDTTIVMYSYWIEYLSIIQCSSLSLSIGFILEYDLSTANATLFLFSFTWNTLLLPLTFKPARLSSLLKQGLGFTILYMPGAQQ